jgi:hypothetical protein
LNYFNYFTEIEDKFVRRRGKHLLISPMDWAIIETWKQLGIPLHVALRGIEQAFDSWEKKPRKRSVKSLLYCQEEVEAQYAEWVESRVGAGIAEADEEESDGQAEQSQPFSRSALLDHLRAARARLLECAERQSARPSLHESLRRATALLSDLEAEVTQAAKPDAQRLEVSLTGIERLLSEALYAATETEKLDEIRKEMKQQLRPYRSHMEKAIYEQTLKNFLLKRLRDQFGVPRLSLFHL